MLNRMIELDHQSANGTYDNRTVRTNLQKEVQSLTEDDPLGGGGAQLTDADIAVGKSLGTAMDDKFIVTSRGAINGGNGTYTIAIGTIDTDGSFTAGADTTDRDIIITREYTNDAGDTVQENFVLKLDDVLRAIDKDNGKDRY